MKLEEDIIPDPHLHNLLNLDPNSENKSDELDNEAVIELIRRNPRAARAIYKFEECSCFPLNKAVSLGASTRVVDALHRAFPEATTAKDDEGYTPLHHACLRNSPIEIISLLIESCGASVLKIKDSNNMLPLHIACAIEMPHEVVSLLLEKYPQAARETDKIGYLPLQYAYFCTEPTDVVKLLLEKYPAALLTNFENSCNEIDDGNSFLPPFLSHEITEILKAVGLLFSSTINDVITEEVLRYFLRIKWMGGVGIVLDVYPGIIKKLEVQDKVIPHLFSIVGRQCNLLTMWAVLRDRQDLLGHAHDSLL